MDNNQPTEEQIEEQKLLSELFIGTEFKPIQNDQPNSPISPDNFQDAGEIYKYYDYDNNAQLDEHQNEEMKKNCNPWVLLNTLPKIPKSSEILEQKRKVLWEKILKSQNFPKKHGEVTQKFQKLVRGGVPINMKRVAWSGCSGAKAISIKTPNYYEKSFQKIYSLYFSEMIAKQGITSPTSPQSEESPNVATSPQNYSSFSSYSTPSSFSFVLKNDKKSLTKKSSETTYLLSDFVQETDKDFLQIFQGMKPSKMSSHQLIDQNQFFYDLIIPKIVPTFGGVFLSNPDDFLFLNSHGTTVMKRILCILAVKHPETEYCPILCRILPLMLLFLPEKEAFLILHCMLAVSKSNCWYFNQSKLQSVCQIQTCCKILQQRGCCAKLCKHFEKIGFSLENLISNWFNSLFIPFLSFSAQIWLLDIYFNEGFKALFKLAAIILKKLEPELLLCEDSEKVNDFLTFQTAQLDENDLFNYQGKQKKIFKCFRRSRIKKVYASVLNDFQDMGKLKTSDITRFILPKVKGISEIINMSQFEVVFSFIPSKLRIRCFHSLYDSSIDGYSLKNFYRKMENLVHDDLMDKETSETLPLLILFKAVCITEDNQVFLKKKRSSMEPSLAEDGTGSVLLKKTKTEGEISKLGADSVKLCTFGVYTEGIIRNKNKYEGNPSTFVFNLFPKQEKFEWTEKNNYFVFGGNKKLMFGGGGEGAALTVDDEICLGSSQKSETFANESLTGYPENEFRILRMEVWFLK